MDPIVELKQTCEQIGRAFEEFKAENDKQISKAVKNALAESKLEQLGQAIDDLTGKKEDLEKRIKLEAEHREELERKVNALKLSAASSADEGELKSVASFNLQIKGIAIDRRQAEPQDVDAANFRAYKSGFQKLMRRGKETLTNDEIKAMQVGIDADGG